MENTDTNPQKDPVQLFYFPEKVLLTILGVHAVLAAIWLTQSTLLANIAGLFIFLLLPLLFLYIVISPFCFLGYFWREFIRAPESDERNPNTGEMRFPLNITCWVAVLVYVLSTFLSALGGTPPIVMRVIEGPDTRYAHSGFEKLLKRPVPSHVTRVTYQNRNNILDEHEILYFNTPEEALIDELIREFKLEPGKNRQNYGTNMKSVNVDYFELLGGGSHFYLSYNRDTGDAKFEWISF